MPNDATQSRAKKNRNILSLELNSQLNLLSLSGLPFEHILSYFTIKQTLPLCQVSKLCRTELEKSLNKVDLRDFKNHEWCQAPLFGFLKRLSNVKALVIEPVQIEEVSDADDDFWSLSGKVIWWAVKVHSLIGFYAKKLEEVRITHSGLSTWVPILAEYEFPRLQHLQLIDDYMRPNHSKLQMIKTCFRGKLTKNLQSVDFREFHMSHMTQILLQLSKFNLAELRKMTLICDILPSSKITKDEIDAFLCAFSKTTMSTKINSSNRLTEVNLMNIDFTQCDTTLFCTVFEGLFESSITDIAIYNCSMSNEMASSLSNAIAKCHSLQQFQLHNMSIVAPFRQKRICNLTMVDMVESFPWQQYKEVRLGNFFTKYHGVFPSFIRSMETLNMERLLTLHLTYNRIGDMQVQKLAMLLPRFQSIQTLVLDHNRISNSSLQHIEKASRACRNLFLITLMGNQYDRYGVITLLESLRVRDEGSIKFILDKCKVEEMIVAGVAEAQHHQFDVIEPSMYMHECDHAIFWKQGKHSNVRVEIFTVNL